MGHQDWHIGGGGGGGGGGEEHLDWGGWMSGRTSGVARLGPHRSLTSNNSSGSV